ncbi:MAG: FtsQ-type POTRA domain-containing protein [Chloracidobacterium sp.]|uniref:FtsQ-type POTRA domain-containing protein n=1 Tax=Chloracidobacterium validum TaxID=2821543 RepID=A0ABX8BCK2_9BACT|nr:FtsQ-type POTRA domain-containing protein [Chloracidobacterium validum]QUW03535.1 FtsQ-type POTRA domain-containing protein [Chloracidobacterium validum]
MSVARERTTRQVVPSRREQTREAAAVRRPRVMAGPLWDTLRPWQPWLMWGALLIGLSGFGFAMTQSDLFNLRHVEVVGCQPPLAEDIERATRQQATGSLLVVSLTALRQNLESLARVRRARVVRILPDTLRIIVEERKPVVLAQMAERSGLVWLDEEGVVLSVYDPDTDGEPPSIAVGFVSDREPNGQRENRARLQLYRNLMWALDAATPRLSERVESVDVSHPDDVRIQLRDTRITIGLGKEDFRVRLLHACEIVDALQRRDMAILERLQFSDPRIFERAPYLRAVNMVNPKQVNLEFDERLTAGAPRAAAGASRPTPPTSVTRKTTDKKPPEARPRATGPVPRR